MKIVLSSRGSRGDVQPIIEIATGLRKAGYQTSICVPRLFEETVKRRDLPYSLYSEDSNLMMQGLGSGYTAIKTALDWFSRSFDEQFEYMLHETEDADAMVSSVNEIAAPTVAEYRGIPHIRIAYTIVLPGSQPPPLIPWQGLPGICNLWSWRVINGFTWLLIGRFINKKRRELGMDPMPGPGRYFTENSHTVMTINERLAPPCPSWRGKYRYRYSGYCYGDIAGGLDASLEQFLNKGPAPVYIGFGSVSVDEPERFTAMIMEAIEMTGCRVILGSGWTGLGSSSLPRGVMQVGDTNHASLFPRLAGIAHHGGSGTTHTAARAGIPQFIMPQIADQFYWGHRVHRLGLGPAPVAPKRLTAKKLADALREMAIERRYTDAASAFGAGMRDEDGIPDVVSYIKTVLSADLTGDLPEQLTSAPAARSALPGAGA